MVIDGRGGSNRKTQAEHLRDGTYRADRHGPRVEITDSLLPKPKHLPPSRRKVPKKWIRTPMDQWCADNGYWFDERFAKHFREFGRKYLKLWEGSAWYGQPFDLMDWQYNDVFAPLMGWFYWDEEWGKPCRRFSRAYIEVAKKNGKSPMAAFVGCYLTMADGEAGGKVFSAASTKEQACIVHEHAVQMVKASAALIERSKIHGTTKSITYKPLNSIYRAISSEAGSQEGLNGSACIADELHVWKGRKLWNALKYMFASKPDPLLFMITTAGEDNHSVCFEQHEYAEAVTKGKVDDPGYFGYIRCADPDDDPGSPETWAKANPSLGVTVKRRELAAMYNEATVNEGAMASFKRYRLNIWCKSSSPWLDMNHWKQCEEAYTEEDLIGEICYAGLDLSKTRDTTALTLLFPWDGGYRQLAYFWLPEDTIEKYQHLVDYRTWVKRGWLTPMPGAYVDYSIVERKILEIDERFDLRGVHYDPYRAAALMQRLKEDHGIEAVEFPQTILKFAEPMEEYERAVISHEMKHNGNDVLTWQADNAQVKIDANNNKRPIKPEPNDVRKIDGVVAGVMGMALAMGDTDYSEYEDEDADLMTVEM